MASKIDTSQAERAFQRMVDEEALRMLGAAAFRHAFTGGMSSLIGGGGFAPNSPEWAERKRKKGWGSVPWVRTGATQEAITNNPPDDSLKTKRKVRFGLNKRGPFAFAQPRAFTDSRGRRRLPGPRQERVLNTMRYGSPLSKLSGQAAKEGRSLGAVLDGIAGAPDRRGRMIPARPLIMWRREWEAAVTKDVDGAITAIFRKHGFRAVPA